jgi:hypothetical protein
MGFLDHKLATMRATPYKTYSKGQQRNTRVEEIGQEGHDENNTPLISFPHTKYTVKLVLFARVFRRNMATVLLVHSMMLTDRVFHLDIMQSCYFKYESR